MKKWKELSQEERDQFKAQNPGGKASYRKQRSNSNRRDTNKLSSPLFDNAQRGSRMGPTAPAKNPEKAAARIAEKTDGAKYNQLTDVQKAKVDRKTYKQAKQAQTQSSMEGNAFPTAGMKQYDDTNDGYKNKVTRNQYQTKLAKREAANKGVEAPASLKQYDPSSLGNDKINKKDIRFLMSKAGGGYSAKQINKYLKNQNVEAGVLAQNMLNKRLQEVNPKAPVTDITDPGADKQPIVNTDPNPAVDVAPTPTPPSVSFDKDMGSSFTGGITGDGNSVDLSNKDFSVNITGSGGSSNGGGSGLSNMASSVAYSGLNELNYQKSQELMSGSGRAADAVNLGMQQTGVTDRITDLTNTTNAVPDKYADRADAQMYRLYGDTYSPNYQVPTWNPVKAPKPNDFNPAKAASMY